jgi:hypothetical protein
MHYVIRNAPPFAKGEDEQYIAQVRKGGDF